MNTIEEIKHRSIICTRQFPLRSIIQYDIFILIQTTKSPKFRNFQIRCNREVRKLSFAIKIDGSCSYRLLFTRRCSDTAISFRTTHDKNCKTSANEGDEFIAGRLKSKDCVSHTKKMDYAKGNELFYNISNNIKIFLREYHTHEAVEKLN